MKRSLRHLFALTVVVSTVLVACGGGDDDDDAAPSEQESEDFDADGVLKIPALLTNNSQGAFDPLKSFSQFDLQRLVYDTFLRHNEDGSFAPGLAKSWTVVDPSTIDLELQSGVKFSDGTPFDGAAVKAGLLRNAAGPANGFRAEVKELQDVVVTDPTHITIKLKSPIAGSWLTLLDSGETMIVSPKAVADGVDLNTHPVGAGPYVLESFQLEGSAVFEKNPTYFQADEIKLAGIQVIHVADAAASINGIRAGALDALPQITQTVASQIQDVPDVTVESRSGGNAWHQIFLCKSKPPFDNVDVRRALNFAADKEGLSELLYGKEGEPVEGSWPKGHDFYNEDLAGMYDYDPEEARDLLTKAGYNETTNKLSFTAYFTAGGEGQQVMEIMKAQFAEVGVDMTLAPTTAIFDDFLTNAKQPAAHIPMQRQGTGKITRIYGATSPVNVCRYNNPELESTMTKLAAADQTTPSDEAVDLWHQAQEIVQEEALGVFLIFTDEGAAWNETRVGGATLIPSHSTGSLLLDYFKAFIKK